MTRMCCAGAVGAIGCDADRVGRFQQRVRVENELRISLRVKYCPGQQSHAARGSRQRMHDHFTGMNDAVHSDGEKFRVGLNDCREPRARIGAGGKRIAASFRRAG